MVIASSILYLPLALAASQRIKNCRPGQDARNQFGLDSSDSPSKSSPRKHEIKRDRAYRSIAGSTRAKGGCPHYFLYACRLGRGIALTLSARDFRNIRLYHFFVHKRLSSVASPVGLGLYGIGFLVCISTLVFLSPLEEAC